MALTYPTLGTVAPGDVLRANSGTAPYNSIVSSLNQHRTPPMCLLRKTGTQAVTNGGFTAITFGSGEELYDTDGMHSIVSQTSRIIPTTAGLYLVTGWDYLSAGPATGHALRLRKNGGSKWIAYTEVGANVSGLGVTGVEYFNGTTDYVEMETYYAHSGSLTTNASVFPTLAAYWLGQP